MTLQESSSGQQASAETQTPAEPATDSSASGASAFASALAQQIDGDDAADKKAAASDEGKASESKKAAPGDLSALAERLGVKVEDLYSVKVPASAGREPMTIGQIKDKFAQWDSLEADRLALSERQVKADREQVARNDEVRELLSMIPKEQLNKEVLERAAARVVQRRQQATAELLASIPEWKDEARRAADLKEISTSLKGYGIPEHFAASITDPGIMRFLRDAIRREAQVNKALEAVREVKRTKPVVQQASGSAPRIPQQQQSRNTLKPLTGRERFSAALNNSR
jgi:hypothetical protein